MASDYINMKNLRKYIIVGILFVAGIVVLIRLENNADIDKTKLDDNTVVEKMNDDRNQDSSQNVESEESIPKLYTNNLCVEVLSCEVVEDVDIEKQTTYPAEWFLSGKLPDSDYREEVIDYEAIKEECPQLRDIWENDGKYSDEEVKDIYNQHLDVIEKYTTMEHPKTKYYFVKCKITNLSKKTIEASVGFDTFVTGLYDPYLIMHEGACYFDEAVYIEGDEREKQFFWHTFKPNEIFECVVGYEIKVEDDNTKCYIGVQTPGVDNFTVDNTQLIPLEETGDSHD